MKKLSILGSLAVSLAIFSLNANAQTSKSFVAFSYASTSFDVKSGDLVGPFTPPGVRADVGKSQTAGIEYAYRFADRWSVSAIGGVPLKIKFSGAGTAQGVGQIGSARIWFPAVVVNYYFADIGNFRPFVSAGLNYTWYSDTDITAAYSQRFGGTASRAKASASLAPVLRLGVEYQLSLDWFLFASYSRYNNKSTVDITTQTPGVGDVTRSVTVRSNPSITGIGLAYRF